MVCQQVTRNLFVGIFVLEDKKQRKSPHYLSTSRTRCINHRSKIRRLAQQNRSFEYSPVCFAVTFKTFLSVKLMTVSDKLGRALMKELNVFPKRQRKTT